MFGSTYLCEAAFSALVAIKTKYRNRLAVEEDLRSSARCLTDVVDVLLRNLQNYICC